jgi:hypothetical protein
MRVNVDHSTRFVTITLNSDEAQKLCDWFEYTTTPAPDPDADVPAKLEDMVREILES